VLPVIYDHISHEIDNENFQEILNVVRGLAANDERIIEEFKDKSQNSGRVTGAREEIFRIDPELLEESELVSNLSIKLWDKLSRFNWASYIEAKKALKEFSFQSKKEFDKAHALGKIPKNIPKFPSGVYKKEGWVEWADFLSNKNYSTNSLFEKLTYNSAKIVARDLKCVSVSDYKKNFPVYHPK
jgi:hypothetical protein